MSHWQQKVAVVTGASSGLGLYLTTELVRQGAGVVLVGRNQQRLDDAVERIGQLPYPQQQLLTVSADITQADDVERIFESTIVRFKQLDLLVNCAGRSMRGLASDTSIDDFRELFELNALATVRCCQGAIRLLRQTRGTIINIGSIASRIAPPSLGAYPPSKFAMAAYSEQLRRELSPEGVHVLTVFPGPIARDDEGQRYSDQTGGLGEGASRPGGSRLSAIDPAVLSKRVLVAAERRRTELMPRKARAFCLLALCFPRLGDWIVGKITE